MPDIPSISGKNFIKLLESIGFSIIRINGSHHRLKHPDGRVTTVPVHKNIDLPKGLIRKIIREDLEMSISDLFPDK
jgi:predicted RNA binding protein YcfA (HicA-like mRNA interferase family)